MVTILCGFPVAGSADKAQKQQGFHVVGLLAVFLPVPHSSSHHPFPPGHWDLLCFLKNQQLNILLTTRYYQLYWYNNIQLAVVVVFKKHRKPWWWREEMITGEINGILQCQRKWLPCRWENPNTPTHTAAIQVLPLFIPKLHSEADLRKRGKSWGNPGRYITVPWCCQEGGKNNSFPTALNPGTDNPCGDVALDFMMISHCAFFTVVAFCYEFLLRRSKKSWRRA